MKFKPIYIYLVVIVLAVVLLLIFTSNSDKKTEMANKEMPQDEIHKGMGGGNPSGGNVSSEIKHKMEMLRKAYQENPDDTLAARKYADFLSEAHGRQDAVKIYEGILEKDKKRTDIRFSLALVYYRNMDFDKAEKEIREVFKYDKNNGQAKYNLGAIQASRGNKDEAKKIWNEVIKENPNSELSKMAQESLKALGA